MSYYEQESKSFDWKPFSDKGAIILNPHPAFSEDQLDDARRAVELINNRTFRHDGMISHKFTLDEVQKAMDYSVNNKADVVKAVIRI